MSENTDQKKQHIDKLHNYAQELGFTIIEENLTKPWGAYFRFDDADIDQFIQQFFAEKAEQLAKQKDNLSPKFLLVAPNARLSWQYHHRRAELWKVLTPPIGAIISDNNSQGEVTFYKANDLIEINQGQRHRIVGGDDWGMVAEIWMHTDPDNPSDEEDNVRLADDYNRQGSNDRGDSTFIEQ